MFVALITPAWHHDGFLQRQYTYAKQQGKTIVLLIQQGTVFPPDADDYCWRIWHTMDECAAFVREIEHGQLP